jgi:hypothetical protein
VSLSNYLETIDVIEQSKVSKIQLYKWYMIKERALYENLNKMMLGKQFFVGLFWMPLSQLERMNQALEDLKESKVKQTHIFSERRA